MKNTLLIEFSKYLKSEGIYCTQLFDTSSNICVPIIIACIASKFVVFDTNNLLPEVAKKRILRNGGIIHNPTSLDDFVKVVREMEK